MLTRAKMLTVGTSVATLLWALGSAAAGEDCCVREDAVSVFEVDQEFTGKDFVSDTTVIADEAAPAAASATSLGNAASASVEHGDLTVDATQTISSTGSASASLTADTAGDAFVASSLIANGVRADGCCATINMDAVQTSEGTGEGYAASASMTVGTASNAALVASTTANAVSASTSGFVAVDTRQTHTGEIVSSASVQADRLEGSALFGAQSTGNALTSTSDGGGFWGAARQSSDGARIQATTSVYARESEAVTATSTGTGGSINVDHLNGEIFLDAEQFNAAYVRGETYLTIDERSGDVVGLADAFGNTTVVSGVGGDEELIIDQVNLGGGVDAVTQVASGDGEGSVAGSAVAYGNAISAVACSACQRTMTATTSQTNDASVYASTTVTGGGAGGVSGSAVAIGNAATFEVRRPH